MASFSVVMVTVIFILLESLMANPVPYHGSSVDLPTALHWVWMPRASRESALVITVTRDGRTYLGNRQVPREKMSAYIRIRVINGAERKVYLKVDQHARYSDVVTILDGLRPAGVENIAFEVFDGRPSQSSRK